MRMQDKIRTKYEREAADKEKELLKTKAQLKKQGLGKKISKVQRKIQKVTFKTQLEVSV